MTRSWFKCAECGIECDNSAVAPGYADKPLKICQICDKSYCLVCDSLYPEPAQAPSHGYFAVCAECGYDGYFDEQVARNIVELNRADSKETHQ